VRPLTGPTSERSAPPDWAGIGIVLAAAVAIGFAPIFAKLAIRAGTGPIAAAGWRLVFAAAATGSLLAALRLRAPAADADDAAEPPPGPGRWALLVPGVLFAGDLATWHLAFELTTAANATVLANAAVLIVSAVGYFFLRERFDWRLPAGAVVGLAGVASLIGLSFGGGEGKAWGDLLSLGTASFYAAYILSIKWVRGRYGTLAIVVASSAVGALTCFPFAALRGESLLPTEPIGWAYLVGLGLVSHALGQGFIALSLRRLPASLVSVLLLTQPCHVAWLGFLLLDEALTLGHLASMAAILVGVALAIYGRRPTAPPEEA